MTGEDVEDHLLRRAQEARKEGRLADARSDLLAVVGLFRDKGRRPELAQALRNLGELERRLPDTAIDARRHYEEAVATLRDLDNPLKLAHTVRHLGDVHHDAGRSLLAEPCYVEAVMIYRSHDDAPPLDLANALRSLAVLKDEADQIEEATRLWWEAHNLYETLNLPAGVVETAARLALLAKRQRDLPRSGKWLSKASAVAAASGDPQSLKYVREVSAELGY
jgi:tetratricopeptide (TPR) repeat protein